MIKQLLHVLVGTLVFLSFPSANLFCAKTIEKSFPVGPGGSMEMTVSGSSVTVEGSSRSNVHVRVESKKDIEEYYKLSFEQEGNKLIITAERKKESRFFGLIQTFRGKGLKFTVSVPENFNPQVRTSGGSIRTSTITGTVDIHTSGGSLTCKRITGSVAGHTSGGSITCEGIAGSLSVRTSGGSIKLSGIEGPFEAKTSGGSVTAVDLTGDGSLRTSGGRINVESCRGALDTKTSGGSISIAGLKGNLTAHTSGGGISAELLSSPSGDCTLKTSGGGIDISLPRESNVTIYAKASGGKVHTDIPVTVTVQGEIGRGLLEGNIGSGGPLVSLKTSGGGIRISETD